MHGQQNIKICKCMFIPLSITHNTLRVNVLQVLQKVK